MLKDLYTIDEVAKTLRVSKRTILREIDRGKLNSSKAGRRIIITQKSLSNYLQNKENGSLKENVKNFIDKARPQIVNMLQKMVALPSVGYKQNQEGALADYLNSQMDCLGIRSVVLREGEVVAVRGSYGWAEDGLAIDCPLDTAPVGDINKWEYPPFGGIIKGGKMYGRGVADCKAGIVAAIYAVLALKKFVDEEKVRVELVFDGGEQDGSYKGMHMVMDRGLHASSAIIGYAGDEFDLAIGARGYHRYTFVTHGKSAHTGARYAVGINAIEKMVNFIRAMNDVRLPVSNNKYFPFGQRMTFSLISGGREINIVPDECMSRMDFRVTPDFSKEFVDNLIRKVTDELGKKDKDFKIDVNYDLGNEGYVVDENDKIVKSVENSVYEVFGKNPRVIATGPSNIGSVLAKIKVPAVVWGPRGGNVHSYNEYIDLDSLTKTAETYFWTILKYFDIE